MTDASEEDRDVQLQRASADLIADFGASLEPFLYRTNEDGTKKIRRRVRTRETERLIGLLEPFQELPQLLDPHLQRLVPILSDALLEYLRLPPHSIKGGASRDLLVTLSKAICKLLYTFTKIRGEKVIVRFFGAETKHLELLLSAVEKAELESAAIFVAKEATRRQEEVEALRDTLADEGWSWEERYICLLWLSHLLLVPFDLASISSSGIDIKTLNEPGLKIPPNVPGVTLKVLPLALKYLGSAGKERDAAKALLVRISMRRDMQELGLLHNLVHWAMTCLKTSSKTGVSASYYYIGILSYLAGILNSSLSTADMDPYLLQIFRTVQNISDSDNAAFGTVHTSATARKTVVKVLRTICVLVLRKEYIAKGNEVLTNEIVETTIGHLLDALADNDTPVRLGASKALSIITFKLDADQASQVVDAVLESLQTNVLLDKETGARDLSAVNPLEWHGLMLTLSHLLYRKSPPISSLAPILRLLLTGLTFEQRSTSGSSIGTNVRDAACFGIWALARRYTTKELTSVKLNDSESDSVIQYLATNLVVAASLDPAGNIRRGSSAALQELIGRHPDVVTEGISVVQVVDYHAVALRSRAMTDVALGVSKLGVVYEDALTSGLLGWRGIGDGDASCRRTAARAMVMLKRENGERKGGPAYADRWEKVNHTFHDVHERLQALKPRELDKRHGLILCLSSLITAFLHHYTAYMKHLDAAQSDPSSRAAANTAAQTQLSHTITHLQRVISSKKPRKPDNLFEASCRLISAGVGLLRVLSAPEIRSAPLATMDDIFKPPSLGPTQPPPFPSEGPGPGPSAILNDIFKPTPPGPLQPPPHINFVLHDLQYDFPVVSRRVIDEALKLTGTEVLDAAVSTMHEIMDYSRAQRDWFGTMIYQDWPKYIRDWQKGLAKQPGYLFALGGIVRFGEEVGRVAGEAVLEQWGRAVGVEDRVVCLRALGEPEVCLLTVGREAQVRKFVDIVAVGLDDYTTDSRGDVGSLVRIEALKCAYKLFCTLRERCHVKEAMEEWYRVEDGKGYGLLFSRVLRLSAEKLDRVRTEAQRTLAVLTLPTIDLSKPEDSTLATLNPSSTAYFKHLLQCQAEPQKAWLLGSDEYTTTYDHAPHTIALLTGLVTSIDTGSESLVRASRLALDEFCRDLPSGAHQDRNTEMVIPNLIQLIRNNAGNDNDRILIPALETLGFLFDAGVAQHRCTPYRTVFLLVQKSHYKSGSVRKLEVCVKIYGYLMEFIMLTGPRVNDTGEVVWGKQDVEKVVEKVTGMLVHPFVSVRGAVADTVHMERGGLAGMKGRDWGKAGKGEVVDVRRRIRDGGM